MTGGEGVVVGIVSGMAGTVVLVLGIAALTGGLSGDRWCAGDSDLGGPGFEVCGPETQVRGYVRELGADTVRSMRGNVSGNPVTLCQARGRFQGDLNGWEPELVDEYLQGCTKE